MLKTELQRRPADLLPDYRLDWLDPSVEWTLTPEGAGEPEFVAEPVLDGERAILFEIVAPAEWLGSLSLRYSNYGHVNTVEIRCELLDSHGNQLAVQDRFPDVEAASAYQTALDLRSTRFSIGRKYWIRLSSPTATLTNCLGVLMRRVTGGRYLLPPNIKGFRGDRLFVWRENDFSKEREPSLNCYAVVPSGTEFITIRNALQLLDGAFPESQFTVVDLGPPHELRRLWPRLATADVVAFCDLHVPDAGGDTGYDALCFELYRRGVCTIFVDSAGLQFRGEEASFSFADGLNDLVNRRSADRRSCRFVLQRDDPHLFDNDDLDRDLNTEVRPGSTVALSNLLRLVQTPRKPRVCIVSVLYKKANVIERFIDQIVGQTYPGPIELVLVNDLSPEADAEIAKSVSERLGEKRFNNRKIQVVDNEQNLGNCGSRLVGLRAAEADIYIVIDCDCLINHDFVAAHVFEHGREDVDAVIGPLNIESWDRDPADLIAELEADPSKIKNEASAQDVVQPNGFVNCITRNFSAKARIIDLEPLFDDDFSYSAKPDTGFGWEDVEMGYRLYARGAVIRFTERAFSVHVSHPSSVPEERKILGSFRNFDRLFRKHPDMALAARRWAVDTYDKLLSWAANSGVEVKEPLVDLQQRFGDAAKRNKSLVPLYRPGHRRRRVLTYRWHVPHQYELYKLPHDFTLVTHSGDNGMVNAWSHDQRPLPENVRLVHAKLIDPREFDLAILHFDENVLAPSFCNNVIPMSWGEPLDWLMAIPELPKIAICHGTPQFEGQYALNPAQITNFDLHEDERHRIVQHFADAQVKIVCNSWQALKEWEFQDSRVIWHGFDPQEFPAGTQARDILALAGDRHRPHYRGAWEHALVQQKLDPQLKVETAAHYGATLEKRGTKEYAVRHFRSYVDRIRQFTAYLNTTLRSPMPRSRGEAMMTGVIPVALANHDVQLFLENGKNGFYSEDPLELADWLNYLFRHPDDARAIAAAARKTAMDVFNHDRYLASWSELIGDVLGEAA